MLRTALIHLFFIFILLIVLVPTAKAHQSYIKELSGWLTYEEKEYRLEGWFGDGIFFSDPVRVILRRKDGEVFAITGIGKSPDIDCFSIDDCWVLLEPRSGSGILSWKLAPEQLQKVEFLENSGGGPKVWNGGDIGFEAKEHPRGGFYYHRVKIELLIITSIISGIWCVIRRRNRKKAKTT